MDGGCYTNIQDIAGINLGDYYPERRCYNSIVFVHKKFLPKHNGKQIIRRPDEKRNCNDVTELNKSKKKRKEKVDKSCQFNDELRSTSRRQRETKNVDLLGQTIKFAKYITPISIPPLKENNPPAVFYTIKATKSAKSPPKQPNVERQKSKATKTESSRKEIYRNHDESISVRESITHSSKSCIVDEINMNQSLCCSVSEISDRKYTKTDQKKDIIIQKKTCRKNVIPSDSLEAVANELANASGDTKIKVHLMNDIDKSLLTENIRVPVINAIKECIFDLHRVNDIKGDINVVQRVIKCNTSKLDNICERLSCIEKKLEHVHTGKSLITIKSPKRKAASKLEELGADLIAEENESSSTQGEASTNEEYSRNKSDNIHGSFPCMSSDLVEVLDINEQDNVKYRDLNDASRQTAVISTDYVKRGTNRNCW